MKLIKAFLVEIRFAQISAKERNPSRQVNANKPKQTEISRETMVLNAVPGASSVAEVKYFGRLSSENHISRANKTFACGVGFGLGTIFHLSCIVAGAFDEPFILLKRRVADFFENLTVSPSLAFRCYAQDIRDDGVTFTVYFLIMLACFVLAVNGIKATWF